ncbi:MAG: hypothetical protein CVU69_08200 [Deltaproteobacteria bacterium HGW-Deltaproteobacteria-4]|nr:MAG: hypothetical protein CVU69_08200 [Deltaproteobacteria bacterium HGW-Deltaproteobacteria-4]
MHRLPFISFYIFVVTMLPMTATFAASPEIPLKEGAWNITLQLNPKTPDFLPIVQMLCLSQNEPVPIPAKNAGCRLLTKEIEGNTVFWVAECREKEFVTRSVGNATYDISKVEGAVQTMTSAVGKETEMRTYTLTGKRQGNCR